MARHLAWTWLIGLTCAVYGLPTKAADPPTLTQTATADVPQDLALAAACLERGEETAAVAYLTRFVTSHPDQPLVRASLAELLWRREQFTDARTHYEHFLIDAQLASLDVTRQVHAHSRLMAIAQRGADAYAEHLHRGIALYLIAKPAAADPAEAERLLCKAVVELTLAERERPDEARPKWYLHLVWSRLGQSLPAARSLRQAVDRATHSELTPAERCDLALAASEPARGR